MSSSVSSSPSAAKAVVEEFVRRQVPDWDDEIVATVRFKAFSGQRSDWEPQFFFWRDLILKVARHLGLCAVRSSELKNIWFSRGGLTPLCLEMVLQEMYHNGDILLRRDLVDPTSGHLYRIIKTVGLLLGVSKSSSLFDTSEEWLILRSLLQERASDVIKHLSDDHWTSTCIITMSNFLSICKGSNEAFMILSHLYVCGKAQYLSIKKEDIIEGVKVSLVPAALPNISTLDYDALRLIYTTEKLQQQIDVIDCHWERSRKMALASYKLGKKETAYRYIRQSKLLAESRAKCTSLLERVEEVLAIIANAESTKKVSEAIQIGARAIKEHKISGEEVRQCLQELDEHVVAQKQVDEALESAHLHSVEIDDEGIEEEFKKLEIELSDEIAQSQFQEPEAVETEAEGANEPRAQESAESLSKSLSKVSLEAA